MRDTIENWCWKLIQKDTNEIDLIMYAWTDQETKSFMHISVYIFNDFCDI